MLAAHVVVLADAITPRSDAGSKAARLTIRLGRRKRPPGIFDQSLVARLSTLAIVVGLALSYGSQPGSTGSATFQHRVGSSRIATPSHSELAGPALASLPANLNRVVEVASVPTGHQPVWSTYDPQNGFVYVLNENAQSPPIDGSVTVVSNRTVVSSVSVGETPVSAALDTKMGTLYVANLGSDNISVINGTRVIGNVGLSFPPQFVTYNPSYDGVYALDSNGSSIGVIRGLSLITTLYAGDDPGQAVFDSANNLTYVSNFGSPNVTIIQGATVLAQVTTGGYPRFMDVNPVSGYVYVPDGQNNVTIFDNASILTKLNLGTGATLVALNAKYDAANGLVYIADEAARKVSIINGTVLKGSVSVGILPVAQIVDSSNGNLYVCNQGGNDVTIINGTVALENVSTGLTPWTGSYDPTDSQMDVVAFGSDALDILEPASVFNVTFTEAGLAPNSDWTVQVNGTTNSTTSSQIGFVLPNGTYTYYVIIVPGYNVTPISGPLNVTGSDQSLSVTFTSTAPPSKYGVTFYERGLPSGTVWWIQPVGSATTFSSGVSLTVDLPNGTYTFDVGSSDRSYMGLNGSVRVEGSPLSVNVTFWQVLFSVTFEETGLPQGQSWSVAVNGSAHVSTASIVFGNLSNGSYTYEVYPIANYTVSPSSGSVSVNGNSSTVAVAFQFSPPPNNQSLLPPAGPSLVPVLIGLGISVAAVVALSAYFFRRRARRRATPGVHDETEV